VTISELCKTLISEVRCGRSKGVSTLYEQVADNAPNAFQEQAKSPTSEEIFKFESALKTVTPDLSQNMDSSRLGLQGIRVGQGQGNSFQDLHLSLFGYRFGEMIRQKKISDRVAAAKWVRTNLGGN
jgi:hypothetical protein